MNEQDKTFVFSIIFMLLFLTAIFYFVPPGEGLPLDQTHPVTEGQK